MLDPKFINGPISQQLATWVGINCMVRTCYVASTCGYWPLAMAAHVATYLQIKNSTIVTMIFEPFLFNCVTLKLSNLIISSLHISFRFLKYL